MFAIVEKWFLFYVIHYRLTPRLVLLLTAGSGLGLHHRWLVVLDHHFRELFLGFNLRLLMVELVGVVLQATCVA